MTSVFAAATRRALRIAARGLACMALLAVSGAALAHGGDIKVGSGPRGPVHLTPRQIQALDVRTATAGPHPLAERLYLNGQVQLAPGALTDASSRIAGQVTALFVQVGDRVQAGQRLARVQSRLVGDPPPSADVLAPRAGIVQTVNVRVGQAVEPATPLLGLGDAGQAGVLARVYEEDLGKVRVGQTVAVTTLAFPGETFAGRVQRLDPVLDPDSRTLGVWVALDRPDPRLRPNLFARAGLLLRDDAAALSVPSAAIVQANGERFVFVREKDEFKRVEVATGASDGAFTAITEGLVPGDAVVTQGVREIYTRWLTGDTTHADGH